jgi:hypothetical protein
VQDVAERDITTAADPETVEGIADIRASDEGKRGRAVLPEQAQACLAARCLTHGRQLRA